MPQFFVEDDDLKGYTKVPNTIIYDPFVGEYALNVYLFVASFEGDYVDVKEVMRFSDLSIEDLHYFHGLLEVYGFIWDKNGMAVKIQ